VGEVGSSQPGEPDSATGEEVADGESNTSSEGGGEDVIIPKDGGDGGDGSDGSDGGGRDADADVTRPPPKDAAADAPVDTGPPPPDVSTKPWPPTGATVWSGNGHAYRLVAPTNDIDWTAASTAAQGLGGYLVTLTSSGENDFVYGLFKNRSDIWNDRGGPWTGGFQQPSSNEPDRGWSWVNGDSWNYSNWNVDQPNNLNGNEDRVVYGIQKPSWNDTARGNVQPAYIVEWDPP
jgi:hypothetical protein